jgi:hypothetical protein
MVHSLPTGFISVEKVLHNNNNYNNNHHTEHTFRIGGADCPVMIADKGKTNIAKRESSPERK